MRIKGIFILFTLFSCSIFGQEYNTERLLTIAEIWGECYLFHPSVIRNDRKVNWEEALVDYLPKSRVRSSNRAFIDTINNCLLDLLKDPLTRAQRLYNTEHTVGNKFSDNMMFDYIECSEERFVDIESLTDWDSLIKDRQSEKPLVVDCRINSELKFDKHCYSPFHYYLSMFIESPVPISMSVTREHYGWDEYNDWWLYRQQWKVSQEEKQQKDNGYLLPFLSYKSELSGSFPEQFFENFRIFKRPLYLIVNRSFLSYYSSLIQSLKSSGSNIFLFYEDSGRVVSDNSKIKRYKYKNLEFLLNTAVYINSGSDNLNFDLSCQELTMDLLSKYFAGERSQSVSDSHFSFQIMPRKYISKGSSLSVEEKILGIIKVWTVVKYFYPHLENCSIDWNNSLAEYLELVQKTETDKEFYNLLRLLMATLHDSHVSTYHSSILDFSKIFVAPVDFEWIENKAIVSAVDSSLAEIISVGDEIVSINNKRITEILNEESRFISYSNRQGLLANVISPGYFVGPANSTIEFDIMRRETLSRFKLKRTVPVFEILKINNAERPGRIIERGIGYINLGAPASAMELELELRKMESTRSLILDLRNSYPTADYKNFLAMLASSPTVSRQSKIPIVSPDKQICWSYNKSYIMPDTSFVYNKPIMVLIDKSMISRPEDIAISLKSFDNVSFVGEQTQGCDGELTHIYLPGGGKTSFTGQIVSFGNAEAFQSIGIIPDFEVKRTISGLKHSKDEILDRAIEILRKTYSNE